MCGLSLFKANNQSIQQSQILFFIGQHSQDFQGVLHSKVLVQIAVAVSWSVSITLITLILVSSSVVLMSINLRVVRMTNPLNVSRQSVVLIRVILHDSLGSVGLIKGVSALNDIPIPRLPLALVVTSMVILYAVLVLVLGVRVVILVVVSLTAPVLGRNGGQQAEQGEQGDLGETFFKLNFNDKVLSKQ